MITRLSTLQYNMLKLFVSQPVHYCMTIKGAQALDQRPFRSMLLRKWVTYRPGHGFHITRAGRDAFRNFEHHSIERKNPLLPLTSYFDAAAWGLRIVGGKKARNRRGPERAVA